MASPSGVLSDRLHSEFFFWEPLELLVCTCCRVAVWLDLVDEHLRHYRTNNHTVYSPRAASDAQEIVLQIWPAALRRADHDDVQIQDLLSKPVPACPYLETYSDGRPCPHCMYVAREESTLKKHVQKQHSGARSARRGHPKTTDYQQAFPSRSLSGFIRVAGTEAPNPVPQTSLEAHIAQSELLAKQHSGATDTIRPSDPTHTLPFVDRAGFERFFVDLSRKDLMEAIALPSGPEREDAQSLRGVVYRTVFSMFSELAGTIGRSSTALRMLLGKPTTVGQGREPYSLPIRDDSLAAYYRVWYHVVIFCFRAADRKSAFTRCQLSPKQREAYDTFSRRVKEARINTDEDSSARVDPRPGPGDLSDIRVSLSPLQSACFDFCTSLLYQHAKTSDEECPLLPALLVQGVQSVGWLAPGRFSKVLSGFISTSKLLFLQSAVKNCTSRSHENVIDELTGILRDFGGGGRSCPFQWALDLRNYAKSIHMRTGNVGEVRWDGTGEDERLIFRTCRITTSGFQAMIRRRCEDFLARAYQNMFLGHSPSELGSVPWDSLVDPYWLDDAAPSVAGLLTTACWSRYTATFPTLVYGSETNRARFFHADGRPHLRRMEAWLATFNDYMQEFAAVIHLCYGQTSRGTELLSVLHTSHPCGTRRGVVFSRGHFALAITHSKKGNHLPPIYRFLPRPIGELLAHILFHLLPWVAVLRDVLSPGVGPLYEIWPRQTYLVDGPDHGFTTKHLSSLLGRVYHEEAKVEGVRLSDHRHIAQAMIDRHLPEASLGIIDDDGDADDSVHAAIVSTARKIFTAQAGHSAETARAFYAVQPDRLINSDGSPTIDGYFAGSRAWWQWTGFGYDIKPCPSDQDQYNRRMSEVQMRRWERLGALRLERQLQAMLDRKASFRGIQKTVLQAIVAREKYITAIMPTGGGKSYLFLLPAFSGLAGTSIVVLPLRALQHDLALRCRRLKISHAIWTAETDVWPTNVSLVFVTPESAATDAFTARLNTELYRRSIDRVFIDEAHECLHSFRPLFSRLASILDVSLQVVCMSATLMPREVPRLWDLLLIPPEHTRTYRERCRLRHVRYTVTSLPHAAADFESIAGTIHTKLDKFRRTYGADQQALVFVTKTGIADLAAQKAWGKDRCEAYHSAVQDKEGILERFQRGETRVIVTTNALGAGVDFSSVRYVLHVGAPDHFAYLVQESGRVARRLEWGVCELLTGVKLDRPDPDSDVSDYASASGCLRMLLDRYNEGPSVPCQRDELPCGYCDNNDDFNPRVWPEAFARTSLPNEARDDASTGLPHKTLGSASTGTIPGSTPIDVPRSEQELPLGEACWVSRAGPTREGFASPAEADDLGCASTGIIPSSTPPDVPRSAQGPPPGEADWVPRAAPTREGFASPAEPDDLPEHAQGDCSANDRGSRKRRRSSGPQTNKKPHLSSGAASAPAAEQNSAVKVSPPSTVYSFDNEVGPGTYIGEPVRAAQPLKSNPHSVQQRDQAEGRQREIVTAGMFLHQQRTKGTAAIMEQIKTLAGVLEDCCLYCGENPGHLDPTPIGGNGIRWHPSHNCRRADARPLVDVANLIRKSFRARAFVVCVRCYMPTALCKRWTWEERGKTYRQTTDKAVRCSNASIIDLFVPLWYRFGSPDLTVLPDRPPDLGDARNREELPSQVVRLGAPIDPGTKYGMAELHRLLHVFFDRLSEEEPDPYRWADRIFVDGVLGVEL